MDTLENLRQIIMDKYAKGMTDQQIADELGCSHQQINHLRNGNRSFAKMKLETLLRLFPDIRITMGGTDITASDEDATELLHLFRTLNSAGRASLLSMARTLAISPGLSNSPSPAQKKAE